MGCGKKLVRSLPGLGEALVAFARIYARTDRSATVAMSARLVRVGFISRETVNSELARTRGIRLSN